MASSEFLRADRHTEVGQDDVLVVKEVTDLLRCGKTTVYDLFESGDLKGFRVGGAVRIYRSSVDQYISTHSNRTAVKPSTEQLLALPAKEPRKFTLSKFVSAA
jgi:excisionase family DNA binding protein